MTLPIVDILSISYSGQYPNLCSGILKFTALLAGGQERKYVWPRCLCSTGSVYVDSDGEAYCAEGEWEIEFNDPRHTPGAQALNEMVRAKLVQLVNQRVEQPCCGGCI